MLAFLVLRFRIQFFSPLIALIVLAGIMTAQAQPSHFSAGNPARESHAQPALALAGMRLLHPAVVSAGADSIELRKKFFGAQKYLYGENEPENVFNFLGISYRGEFRELLATHPAALQEANKAATYNVIKTLGWLTLVGMSVKVFLDSVNDAQEVSSGRFPEKRSGGGDLAIIVLAGGVSLFSGLQAKKYLHNGVRIFNERQQMKQ